MRRRLLPLLALVPGSLVACDSERQVAIPEFDSSSAEPAVERRLTELKTLVELNPDSAEAWGLLALSLQAHGYPRAAGQAYARARDRRPETFAYYYLPATMLAERGDPEAGSLFERARLLRPDYVPLRLREAAWRLDRGDLDEVASVLEDGPVRAEAPARAGLLLGRTALAAGDLEAARRHLESAATVAPDYGDLHAQLSEVYRREGRNREAELAGRRAAAFAGEPGIDDPVLATLYAEGRSSRWHILRGQGYMAAGQAAAAREAFKQAVEARPEDSHAWNQLGVALQALGRYEEAAGAHRRALELRPVFPDAAINLASSLFLGGDPETGLAAARTALAADTTAAQAYLNLGMFEHAVGRPERAKAAYERGLARAPFDVRIALRLAWLMATERSASLRDGRRSVVLAEAVNEIQNYSEPASLDALAAAYAEYGAFDRAVAAARRALLLAAQGADSVLVSGVADRTALYEQGMPYRE